MTNDIIKHIYNACDPYKPATAEYYVDCSPARGNTSALTQEFYRNLLLADDYLCFLFSGHFGCGKSSELEELARTLQKPSPGQSRYFPILVNVSDYLDDYDVSPLDIQLAIVAEVAAALRNRAQVELKDNYFVRRFDEIKRFFLSDVELKEGELPLGMVKLKLQRLAKDPEARQKVRQTLQPQQSSLLREINTVFEEARLRVQKMPVVPGEQPYTDIVLILDNLEKIRKTEGFPEGKASLHELFVDRYQQFTSFKTHIIYTMPLPLIRSNAGPQLQQRYGPLFVLPMVKVIDRKDRAPYAKGISYLRELILKRVGNGKLEDYITPGALDFLLTYSGGHIRSLMIFLQNACTYTDTLPIPLNAVHSAIGQTVALFSTSIPDTFWPRLASLDRSTNQQIVVGDPDYLVMLENLNVLEYVNGGEENNPFEPIEPWYAVNPIVRELQKFKSAIKTLESTPKG